MNPGTAKAYFINQIIKVAVYMLVLLFLLFVGSVGFRYFYPREFNKYIGRHVHEWRIKRIQDALQKANPTATFISVKEDVLAQRNLMFYDCVSNSTFGIFDSLCVYGKVENISPLQDFGINYLYIDRFNGEKLSQLNRLDLKAFGLDSETVEDITAIAGMPIEYLQLICRNLNDLTPLAGMPLKKVEIFCNAQSLESLSKAPISKLSFQSDELRDITALKGKNINNLILWAPNLENISGLEHLEVNHLEIHSKKLSDISPLRGCKVERLILDCPALEDISPLAKSSMAQIDLIGTRVKDISPLANVSFYNKSDFPPDNPIIAVVLSDVFLEKRELLEKFSNRFDLYFSGKVNEVIPLPLPIGGRNLAFRLNASPFKDYGPGGGDDDDDDDFLLRRPPTTNLPATALPIND